MTTPVRYVICVCGQVYARTVEQLRMHETKRFACDCGTVVGAWNGLLALRYAKIENADARILEKAHRITRASQNTTVAA